jgi:hypothetical protein
MVPRKRHVRGRRGVGTGTTSQTCRSYFDEIDDRTRLPTDVGSVSDSANDAESRRSEARSLETCKQAFPRPRLALIYAEMFDEGPVSL